MQTLALTVVFAVLYLAYRHQDRRLLRNGVFLVAAGWFALLTVLEGLALVVPGFEWVVLALLGLLPLAVLVLAVFLVGNGVTMLRREGRRLANVLSLLAGVALIVVPLAVVGLFLLRRPWALGLAALLFFVAGYLGAVFVIFLVYSLVYARIAHVGRPAALVVLGSKVIDGRIPPLLASRLDKALAIYAAGRSSGTAPLLIPSGGTGVDETGSEGSVMADYLLSRGADPGDVVAETEARNTRENLLLARRVQEQVGRPGPVLAVTNSYHVLRTAILARSIGSDAQVIGSPTAAYYVPSAFLREFVAVLVEHRRLHLALTVPFVVLTVVALLVAQHQGL